MISFSPPHSKISTISSKSPKPLSILQLSGSNAGSTSMSKDYLGSEASRGNMNWNLLISARTRLSRHLLLIRISATTRETTENQSMAPMTQTAEKQLEDQLQHQLPEGGTNTDGFMYIEDVESFLLSDDDMSNSFSALRQTSSASNIIELKEVGSFQASKTEILQCHFSSDGRLLAFVGSGSKITVCNMDSYDFINDWEGHFHIITDVRFRPSSTIFATSSFDRTVQIWDGNRVWDEKRAPQGPPKLRPQSNVKGKSASKAFELRQTMQAKSSSQPNPTPRWVIPGASLLCMWSGQIEGMCTSTSQPATKKFKSKCGSKKLTAKGKLSSLEKAGRGIKAINPFSLSRLTCHNFDWDDVMNMFCYICFWLDTRLIF